VTGAADERDDEPIAHHYVLVLVVEAVTLTALYLLSRWFR
jgi:hypothetical protein